MRLPMPVLPNESRLRLNLKLMLLTNGTNMKLHLESTASAIVCAHFARTAAPTSGATTLRGSLHCAMQPMNNVFKRRRGGDPFKQIVPQSKLRRRPPNLDS